MLLPETKRKNEIEFLALCTGLLAFRNQISDITAFIKSMTFFFKFDFSIVYKLSLEIFDRKYQPQLFELILVDHLNGMTQKDIASKFNVSRATVARYIENPDKVLYPRSTNDQAEELNIFISQTKKLVNLDTKNLL